MGTNNIAADAEYSRWFEWLAIANVSGRAQAGV